MKYFLSLISLSLLLNSAIAQQSGDTNNPVNSGFIPESTVYPNPNDGSFTVKIPFDDIYLEAAEYIIYDVLGRELIRDKVSIRGDEAHIRTSSLPNGEYFIRLRKNEEIVTRVFAINNY